MPTSLFTTQIPVNPDASDNGTLYELGTKFQSTKAGQITAIRYWKAASDGGVHEGRIWSVNGGTPLVTVTFTNETASGWQQQDLNSPLSIQANTTYVVSVNSNGFFAITNSGLASSILNGELSTIADGNNGVFGNPGTFPINSFQSSNYFRDIVFFASNTSTLSKVSGDNQTGAANTTLSNPLVVQVKDGSGNAQAGVTVSFTVTIGGGSVSPTSAVTSANGQASTVLTLGSSKGVNRVNANAAESTVIFTAIANPNAIVLENQKPGTTAWKITNQATTEIAGYASATSVNKGGSLPIKVSLVQRGNYTLDVYRLGYYGGTGGRLITSSGTRSGVNQPIPRPAKGTLLIQCNWSTSYTLQTGADWTSGLYIAKLTDQRTGKQSQIWFVVRDDNSTSDILFQSSFTTFLAYNNFGGRSLYGFGNPDGQRAFKVSFDRPFAQTTFSSGEFNNILRWEYNMVRWLESQGYDVSYVTGVDIHSNSSLLSQHRLFLSVGHDEYWSLEQRNAVEQARNTGLNLCFFSANTAYWRVRFENSSTGAANRVLACYKDDWPQDPVAASNPSAATNKFRSPQNNRPENALLGVMYVADKDVVYGGYDFVVSNSADPYYANTGLQNGDRLPQLVGFEWDAVINNGLSPSGLVVLSQSQFPADQLPLSATDADLPAGTDPLFSNAVRYTAASGAKVFATGSIQWMWGLDSANVPSPREDPRAKQIAVNVLADMGARPLTPDANLIVP